MNKTEIANELLLNTKNICSRELIESSLLYPKEMESKYWKDEDMARFYKCISYIEKTGFDITGWQLYDVPIWYAHCFCNDKTDQYFDLTVWDGKVIPTYLYDCNEHDAESIQEAIEKYSIGDSKQEQLDELQTKLENRISYVMEHYEQGDSIVISYTVSTDAFDKISKISNEYIDHMEGYLKNLQECGVIQDCDPEGVWFRFVDFELVKST